MFDKNRMKRSFFYDWAIDDYTIYFPILSFNALCKADLTNDQVDIIGTFPDIPADKARAYFGIYKFKNYLLLAPDLNTDDFLIYDIESSLFSRMPNEGQIFFYSSSVYEKDNYLYIVYINTSEVNKIDLQNLTVKKMKCVQHVTDNAQINELVRVDDLVYIPLNEKKVMKVFDLDREMFTYYDYPKNISFIATICYYDGKFWITGETRKIYTWKLDETEANEIVDFPSDVKLFYERNIYFRYSFVYDDVLWLFPAYADALLKFNIMTKQFEKLEIAGEEEFTEQIDDELKSGRYLVLKYVMVQRHGNRVFFVSSKTRILYELDLATDKIKMHDLRMSNIYKNQIYPPPAKGVMLEEGYADGLACLMKSYMRDDINEERKKEKVIGEIIYRYIID